MKLSVIIVNYNVKHFLEQCLHAVEKATNNVETEVFVVDNNSVDGSVGMLIQKFPDIKLIHNKQNVGFCQFNIIAFSGMVEAFIVVMHRNCQNTLCNFLADHIII